MLRSTWLNLTGERKLAELVTVQERNLHISLVDDSSFCHWYWQDHFATCIIAPFETPEELLEKLNREPELSATWDAIVIDFDFSNRSRLNGATATRLLRKIFAGPILLHSDFPLSSLGADVVGLFDGYVPKDLPSLAELHTIIRQWEAK